MNMIRMKNFPHTSNLYKKIHPNKVQISITYLLFMKEIPLEDKKINMLNLIVILLRFCLIQ